MQSKTLNYRNYHFTPEILNPSRKFLRTKASGKNSSRSYFQKVSEVFSSETAKNIDYGFCLFCFFVLFSLSSFFLLQSFVKGGISQFPLRVTFSFCKEKISTHSTTPWNPVPVEKSTYNGGTKIASAQFLSPITYHINSTGQSVNL